MANLLEIANLSWEKQFPLATDEVAISRESFVATAKLEYAYAFLLWYWRENATEGVFNMPGNLSKESEPLKVVDNEVDISSLDIMSRLPNDRWLGKIGKLTDDCVYVKSNINQTQLLKDDDSLPDLYYPYVVLGKKIIFPKGTHSNPITIIYAGSGKDIDENIEVDDAIGAQVRNRLDEIYFQKIGFVDKTNNSNPQN